MVQRNLTAGGKSKELKVEEVNMDEVRYMEGDEIVEEMHPVWDFNKNSEIEGKYAEFKSSVGVNQSNIYIIEVDEKDEQNEKLKYTVWGNTVLEGKMMKAKIGERYKIIFLGMKKTEDGKREYKNFKVVSMIPIRDK